MRLAVISDIHANLIALDAALADVAAERVDRMICLGDIAANGPQPHEVIERLRAVGCPAVRGNTDDWFLQPQTFDPNSEKERRLMDMVRWGEQQLAPADLHFLHALDLRVEVTLEGGASLLGFHASPRSNSDFMVVTTPDDEIAKFLAGARATVMAGGHTHVQMLRRLRGTTLINPGSVGMPLEPGVTPGQNRRPPWAEYAIVDSRGDHLRIEFRRVPLERDKVIEAVRASGMPHADWWLQDLR
jgi:predicted phosphodiesterase